MGKVLKALHKALEEEDQQRGEQGLPPDEPRGGDEAVPRPEAKTSGAPERGGGLRPVVRPEAWDVPSVDGWDEKLVVFSEPSSALAENFRLLRARILYPPSGRVYKNILIVSTMPGSGKTFVCANLGVSIAQGMDQHALLVDCDFRRPRLESMFNCKSGRGLVNYLRDGDDLGRLIVKTGMRKLSLIPSGPCPVNPAELLGSAKVERLFAELASRYDDRFILIDTPPTQAASETTVLAKHADGVILVVRWGLGAREPIRQLVEAIGPDKVIGVVFNAYEASAISARMSGYDEYGQYAGGYGAYGGEQAREEGVAP
ncbi:MAG: CpsD/CapB family tyrosine-protein kinase [Desulfobacteraceae bacterium]|nr:CpsD/CapB family tyrosine-protein kinase [Desulfobacteraceae bacterium]